MKRFLYAALAALFVGPALAATGTATITWTRPTTYTDGSVLAASAISGNAIDCVFTPTGGVATSCGSTPATVAGGNTATGTVTLTYPVQGGRACFRVRALVGSVSSDPSAERPEACKDFEALKPNAPSNVTVTITVSVVVNP